MEKGGRTKRISEEFRGLLALGHEVKLVTFCEPPEWVRDHFDGSDQWEVLQKGGRGVDLRLLMSLSRVVRRFRPDVIDTHCEGSAFYAGIVSRMLGSVCVATIHRSNLAYYKSSRKNSLYFRFVHGFVAVSNERKKLMCQELVKPPSTVEVVHWGVREKPVIEREEARTRLGLDLNPILLSVGHLGEIKGHDESIIALQVLLQSWPDAHLYIAGDGASVDYERLTNLASKCGVEHAVTMLGQVGNIADWLAASDVFLQPSREEAFGLVFLEAGLIEKPTVATRIGGIPEIILHGETGLLVDIEAPEQVANAIDQLLSDPEEASRMGRAARRRVLENFLLDDKIASLTAYFEEVARVR